MSAQSPAAATDAASARAFRSPEPGRNFPSGRFSALKYDITFTIDIDKFSAIGDSPPNRDSTGFHQAERGSERRVTS
jgi:hypothetical protein